MYLFSSRCLRKSGSCLNSIKYWQSNFGVNLLSEVIPIDIDALLNAELSFSESPKYSILISPLSSGFKILVAIRNKKCDFRAGYYPNKKSILIKLVADKKSRRILAVQYLVCWGRSS